MKCDVNQNKILSWTGTQRNTSSTFYTTLQCCHNIPMKFMFIQKNCFKNHFFFFSFPKLAISKPPDWCWSNFWNPHPQTMVHTKKPWDMEHEPILLRGTDMMIPKYAIQGSAWTRTGTLSVTARLWPHQDSGNWLNTSVSWILHFV